MKVHITHTHTTYHVTSYRNHIHYSDHDTKADAYASWEDMPRKAWQRHGVTELTVTYYRNDAGQEWRDAVERWLTE